MTSSTQTSFPETQLLEEADRIGRYLLGVPPTPREKQLYAEAQSTLAIQLSPADAALWRSALSSRFLMGIIDSGLALTDPLSLVRKKIFVMLAILEASPDHCDAFLSKPFGLAGIIGLTFRMIGAAVKSLLGLAYLSIIRLRSSAS